MTEGSEGNGWDEVSAVTLDPPAASSKAKVVPHFTPAERAARGKAARAEVPRSSQAEIEFPKRRDPVGLLEEQAVSRVPELVPIRYGRMLVSPFAFYRGGALIMAADLSRTPHSGLRDAAVRRCPPVELRRVRLAGAEPGLRHQRLRRDGAGPVGVGCEAAGGELRDRRTRERFLGEGAAGGRARHGRARTGRRWLRSRTCATSRSGTRSLSVEQAFARVHAPASTRSG